MTEKIDPVREDYSSEENGYSPEHVDLNVNLSAKYAGIQSISK